MQPPTPPPQRHLQPRGTPGGPGHARSRGDGGKRDSSRTCGAECGGPCRLYARFTGRRDAQAAAGGPGVHVVV